MFRKLVRARRELRQLRLDTARLRGERDRAQRRRKRLRAKLNVTEQALDRHQRAVAEGRNVEFEYPYHPHARSFEQSGRSFFTDLLANGDGEYADLVTRLARHLPPLLDITVGAPDDPQQPFWLNRWYPPLDGMTLYALLAENNPETYLEVGSGNSTKFVRRAVRDHGLRTRVISIDPHPRAGIDDLCDEVVRSPFEEVQEMALERVGPGDLFFLDNSHRSFTGSDVTVFFTEVLPYLPSGVLWGVHDTFLPQDYPADWDDRFYNEQYLLMSYLLGGGGDDRIELPVRYLMGRPDLCRPILDIWPSGLAQDELAFNGGSFWMRRGEVSAARPALP